MAKAKRTPGQLRIQEFAKRRAGATYIDASIAAKERLLRLKDEYKDTPPSYRGYLAVGICSCLESHIKYCYAYFLDLAPQYRQTLKELALKQGFVRAQYPLARQYADMGLEADGSLTPEFEIHDEG
jgi:hypothetical protein